MYANYNSKKKLSIALKKSYITCHFARARHLYILASRWRNNHARRDGSSRVSERSTPRSFGVLDSHIPRGGYPASFVAGNNNTHAGIVLGGGYLITDIQMSAAGRLVPSVPLAAGSGCDAASGMGPSRPAVIVGRGGEEGGARRRGRGGPGGRGVVPLVRRGGSRGAGTRQGPLPIRDHPRRNSL